VPTLGSTHTLGGTHEIITSPVFHEDGFDPREEASLRIPEIGSIARNAL
jgi:hypothetical protein